ncbi:MAG: hypothetical protein DWP94_04085 [Flavobacterium sp.]|nr:MAG: hypothetical protein DWP94_04085 [Flavobacterium sp.]
MKGPIVIDNTKFWYSDGILFIEIINADPTNRLSELSLEKYVLAIEDLCDGKITPFCIDMRNAVGTYSIEAAKLFANGNRLNNIRIAEAFISSKIGIKLSIRSFKRIYDAHIPYEIFDTKEQALAHCRSFVPNIPTKTSLN